MVRVLDRIAWTIAAAGAVVSGLAFVVGALLGAGGASLGVGALVGSVVAVADWITVRWLVRLAFSERPRSRLAVGVLMLLKMATLVAVSYVLLKVLHVDVLGFTLGFSSLVLGIVLGARGETDPVESDPVESDPIDGGGALPENS